ncbi:LysR family transcriptional regulator [Enterobacteriaceae bacterium BIT-l23]|uniref:LysR family transcriptional regulator n=1 Tax=Jejubacter sp. L23 TaxID=3092086 RepID=UPI00158556BB|nr:LysR family transcriptional regulator [Enterobacteriaceae bacterium BIT-l23]
MHKTTLEQWALLEKVVELGSFARAAEASNRSQSSVSYNLNLLQERLGVALLQPQGRRAVLTPAGELLLAQARPLLSAFYYLESRAATLRDGVRARLDLVVDAIYPRARLFRLLKRFQQLHPATRIHLTEVLEYEPLSADADVMVLTRRQDISGRGQWLMNIDFVAVAHRDHPLSHIDEPLSEELLARYPLIQIAGRDARESPDHSPGENWIFSTIDAATEAVLHQVGYGWLPEERIAGQLADGTLLPLPLSHGTRRATPLHLLVRQDLTPLDAPVATLLRLFNEA